MGAPGRWVLFHTSSLLISIQGGQPTYRWHSVLQLTAHALLSLQRRSQPILATASVDAPVATQIPVIAQQTPTIQLFYRTGWSHAKLHGSLAGAPWSDFPLTKVCDTWHALHLRIIPDHVTVLHMCPAVELVCMAPAWWAMGLLS